LNKTKIQKSSTLKGLNHLQVCASFDRCNAATFEIRC